MPSEWGTAYLMIDKTGSIAKVEAHREKTKTTYTDKGFDFVSLRFDSPEMEKYNQWDAVVDRYSARKSFLSKWFHQNKGNIDDQAIINVLKDHKNKMCCHDYDARANVHEGICWSWILSPGSDEAAVCVGPPCKNKFRRFRVTQQLEPAHANFK